MRRTSSASSRKPSRTKSTIWPFKVTSRSASKPPNTRQLPTHWGRSGFLRQFGYSTSRSVRVSIRRPLRSCTASRNERLKCNQRRSVRAVVEHAFSHVGRSIAWHGRGIDEVGQDATTGETLVKIDPRYFRPSEVESLCGDASKAHQRLGWRPAVGFEELVREMVDEDMRVADGGRSFRHE